MVVPIIATPVATMPVATVPVVSGPVATIPIAAMPVASTPIAATPVAAAPALAAPRTHSRAAAHSGTRTHRGEMMAATAATARSSCENRSSQYGCKKASQEKQKFRIIHNQSGFLSTSLDTARDSKSRFIFYGQRRIK
jgi:hypothetical protein